MGDTKLDQILVRNRVILCQWVLRRGSRVPDVVSVILWSDDVTRVAVHFLFTQDSEGLCRKSNTPAAGTWLDRIVDWSRGGGGRGWRCEVCILNFTGTRGNQQSVTELNVPSVRLCGTQNPGLRRDNEVTKALGVVGIVSFLTAPAGEQKRQIHAETPARCSLVG